MENNNPTKNNNTPQYLVVPDIESPLDKRIADYIQRIINRDTDTVVLGKLERTIFVIYDYDFRVVHLYTKYPEYLMTIYPKLWELLEKDIKDIYGFFLTCHKIDSELLIIPDVDET